MAKPDVVDWALTGDRVEPTSGKKDAGFVPGEKPPSQFHNWLFGLLGDWTTWLDTVWTAEDGISLITPRALECLNLTSTNNVHATNGYVRTNEANIRHNEFHVWVPITILENIGSGCNWTEGSTAAGERFLFPNNAGAALVIGLPVGVGERIKEIHAYLYDNDGGNNISFKAWKQSIANGAAPGTPSQLGSTQNTASSSTNIQKLSITSLAETVLTDTVYNVEIITAGATTDVLRFYRVKIVYDRVV